MASMVELERRIKALEEAIWILTGGSSPPLGGIVASVPAGGGSAVFDTGYTPGSLHGASVIIIGDAYDSTGNLISAATAQYVLRVNAAGIMSIVGAVAIVPPTGDAALAAWSMVVGVSPRNTLEITFSTPPLYANAVRFQAKGIILIDT